MRSRRFAIVGPAGGNEENKADEDLETAMGSFSIWHWIIVLLLILVLFGRGKVSELMGDVAKGIKSFKRGMAEDDDVAQQPKPIVHDPADPVGTTRIDTKSKVG